jgi:hypothetical protein
MINDLGKPAGIIRKISVQFIVMIFSEIKFGKCFGKPSPAICFLNKMCECQNEEAVELFFPTSDYKLRFKRFIFPVYS